MNWVPLLIHDLGMTHLMIYLGIGFAICIYPLYEAIETINYRKNHEWIQLLNDDPPLFERILSLFVYVIGFILFVVFWPLTLIFMFRLYLKSRQDDELLEEPNFYCRFEHIGNPIDARQAEKEHMIKDPLHLTPDQPFGFLYPAWNRFISSFDENDQLCSFFIPKGSTTGFFEQKAKVEMRGFVKLRGKKIIEEFLVEGD